MTSDKTRSPTNGALFTFSQKQKLWKLLKTTQELQAKSPTKSLENCSKRQRLQAKTMRKEYGIEGCIVIPDNVDFQTFKKQFFSFLDSHNYTFGGLIGEFAEQSLDIEKPFFVRPTTKRTTQRIEAMLLGMFDGDTEAFKKFFLDMGEFGDGKGAPSDN